MKLQEELNNIRKKFLAFEYAYGMCGSSPCVDCNKFRYMTNDEEKTDFLKCVNEARCLYVMNLHRQSIVYLKCF